jgi:GWxTD domain-containing protein
MSTTRISISCLGLSLLVCLFAAQQDDKKQTKNSKQPAAAQAETNARPLTDKERKAREKALRKELATPYRKWLNEDVTYIITDEERSAFLRLQTDEEREQFIEQFWLRRDPSPDTIENEFKEEHYRRIAYANEHYASGIPGWKTDRGRIYITYGPADEVEDHSSGGSYERPPEEGGGTTSTFPFQQWRYRYIEGIGNNVIIEFVDPTMSGEFHMTMDPSEKDALLYVPNAGLTVLEQMGISDKTARFNNSDGTHLGAPLGGLPESMNEFSRLDQYAKLQRPPAIKFHDLEAEIRSKISYNILPVQVHVDFIPVTEASVMTYVTVQFDNKNLTVRNKDGVQDAEVEFSGNFTTISRRPVGGFEEKLSVPVGPKEYMADWTTRKSIGQRAIALSPGRYRLIIYCKDTIGGNLAVIDQAVEVPRMDPDKIFASLILADLIDKVPPRSIGTGQFVIGDTKVRPRIGEVFKRDETLGIYMKLFNFGADETTHRPQGQISYEIFKTGTAEAIVKLDEDVSKIPDASSSQVTIEKRLKLDQFAPGKYTLRMKINDKNRNQTLTQSAEFTVT